MMWPQCPGEKNPEPIRQEAGWVPNPVWMEEKNADLPEIKPSNPACSQYVLPWPVVTFVQKSV